MVRPCRALAFAALALVACGDNLAAGPSLSVSSPERGLIADATSVTVRGRASGGFAPLFGVEVNGARAEVDGDGGFAVDLELGPGLHRIETIAASVGGGLARDVRWVSLGPRAGATPVASAINLAVGTVGLGRVANDTLLPAVDVAPVYAQVTAAPIADVGDTCAHDVITVSEIDAPFARVFLYGLLDGLGGEILFSPIDLTLSAQYDDDNCVETTDTFTFDTLELHLTFDVALSLQAGELEVALTNQFRLYDHELIVDPGTIDPLVADRVTADIETRFADAMVPAGMAAYVELFTSWLEGFARTRGAVIDGDPVEVTTTLVAASASGDGVALSLDAAVGEVASDAWVPTPTTPILPSSPRAAITIADDAVDQLLGAVWALGGFDGSIDAGSLRLLVPPAVAGDRVAVGDWVMAAGDLEVALSGTVGLAAERDQSDVSLAAGEVVLEAQVLAGELEPEALEALVAEASALLDARLDAALSALSVPIAEAAAPMLEVTAESGYLSVDTFIPPPSVF